MRLELYTTTAGLSNKESLVSHVNQPSNKLYTLYNVAF
jgi:hypothetical protein